MSHSHAKTANPLYSARRSGQLAQPRSANSLNTIRNTQLHRAESETWILVYLDVITLLLTFFVFMISSTNGELLEKITESSEKVFEEVVAGDIAEEIVVKELISEQTSGEVVEAQPDLELAKRLHDALSAHDLDKGLEIKVEPGRVNLQMPEKILFKTAQADLIGQANEVLRRIVPILLENDFFLSIEGHTDNMPISNNRFPSNWELSAARASTVIRYLKALGIPIQRMRAVGYADTVPVVSNETVEGRSANRRVTLVIHLDNQEQPGQSNIR